MVKTGHLARGQDRGAGTVGKKKNKQKKRAEQSRILIVEDDLTLLETLEYNLLRQQYEVYKAMDGQTGLEVARQQQPDLVVLDLMLPGLDGLKCAASCARRRACRS